MAATQQNCSSVISGKKHVNGVDLHYEQRGTGKHIVLMCSGPLGCNQINTLFQMKTMNTERFTVVTWDPRGYGQSRPPARDFPIDFLERDAKDAVDLMTALGFDKFSILGWSSGGVVALIAAAKNPDLISKIVVWGAVAYVSPEDIPLYNASRDISLLPQEIRAPFEEVYGDDVSKLANASIDGVLQFAERPEGNICIDHLPLLRCPTLIIHGEKDQVVSVVHAEFLHKNIKGSRLHLMPENGHSVHFESGDEFNKLVEDFLEE